MKITFSLFILSTLAVLFGCANDTHEYTSNAEEILPGRWRIESVSLPANPEGITYQGKTFYNDTVLSDIGEFEIGSFSFYRSSWDTPVSTSIICNLNLDDENFEFEINNLSIGSSNMYGYFSPIVPGGIDTIDTPGEDFIWSSHMFNNNYAVFIDGVQHVRFESSNWPTSEVIELEKIE